MGSVAYNKDHVKQIKFNFNLRTDADILEQLAAVKSMQGYVKALIRADIAAHPSDRPAPAPDSET